MTPVRFLHSMSGKCASKEDYAGASVPRKGTRDRRCCPKRGNRGASGSLDHRFPASILGREGTYDPARAVDYSSQAVGAESRCGVRGAASLSAETGDEKDGLGYRLANGG